MFSNSETLLLTMSGTLDVEPKEDLRNLTSDPIEFRCPLCNSPLGSADYYRAIEELKKKVSETYSQEHRKVKQEYEKKLLQISQGHKNEVADLKRAYEEKRETLRKEMEVTYRQQLAELKKTYEKINRDNKRHFESLEKRLKTEGKKELQEKEKQLKELRREQDRLKKIAFDQGKASADLDLTKLKNELTERDIQIERFKLNTDDLKKQLSQSQSELKGEAGEIDLFSKLTQEFQQDFFSRQKRGQAMGDIIQRIRTATTTLEKPIVYDNKQSDNVTSKDIEKAKRYKDIHATDYVIIVSSNLPKKDVKNGLIGERDGILLCHPTIVVDVVKQMRRGIIEISKQSESRKDREAKESKLYDYIRSQEFSGTVEELHEIYQKMADLQDNEEKAHGRLWRERKKLQLQINDTYVGISNGIDCIIQEKIPMQELLEEHEKEKEEEETPRRGPRVYPAEPLLMRRKKKRQTQQTSFFGA
jgi:hypothetical protein